MGLADSASEDEDDEEEPTGSEQGSTLSADGGSRDGVRQGGHGTRYREVTGQGTGWSRWVTGRRTTGRSRDTVVVVVVFIDT